jgi:stage II sporulation protein D
MSKATAKALAVVGLLLLFCSTSDAGARSAKRAAVTPSSQSHFPQVVRVRLWYLHPPRELQIDATSGHAKFRKCATCRDAPLEKMTLRAAAGSIQMSGNKAGLAELRFSGTYRMNAAGAQPIPADFPIEVKASQGDLLITAVMPMDEYVASVLAGEAGNFRSDEALKALSVAARTFATHFGSRHPLEGFEFCDTTHCQDVRIAGINQRLRSIAESTNGEILWYDGQPAATYYHANCGGTTEDGRYIVSNSEQRPPFLTQHSDQYCIRNGAAQWQSEISKSELQNALAADGIRVPGKLRSVSILHRTSSDRVEMLTITGSGSITVPGVSFRSAVGRHIGWDRLKSNWYDVSDAGDTIVFKGRGSGHGVGLCQVGAEVMGEEGHNYRDILSFYYPGTRLGVSAQGVAWQRLANEDLEMLTIRPDRDRQLLTLGTRLMHEAEESTGLLYRSMPTIEVYPTIAAYRDGTAEPGWVAASTRGQTVRMQPPETLRQTGVLESTLRHEMLHILLESYSHPGTPLWFREGLVLYLSTSTHSVEGRHAFESTAALERALRAPADEQELRRAYNQAQQKVFVIAQQHRKETLLEWLQNGIPPQSSLDRTSQRSARR